MYRKSLLCLIAAGALAISCGDDDPPSGGGDDDGNERGGTSGSSGSSSGGSSGTNEGGEPGTGGTSETGGTSGRGGSSGTAGDAGAGGGGDAIPCETSDPPQCADADTIMLCDPEADNTLQAFACDEFCSTLGLESGSCTADEIDTTCHCGDPIDEECYSGAEEVCSCLQGTEIECVTEADRFAWYLACLDGEDSEDVVRCFAAGSAQACTRTVEECVP